MGVFIFVKSQLHLHSILLSVSMYEIKKLTCLCFDHKHESYTGDMACRSCGDCCRGCGDISSGPAFRRCEHRRYSDDRDAEYVQCFTCGGLDGEHNPETHILEMRASARDY